MLLTLPEIAHLKCSDLSRGKPQLSFLLISADYKSKLNQQFVPRKFRRAQIKLNENKDLLSPKIQKNPSCSRTKDKAISRLLARKTAPSHL
jgi:hypothetical protein